MKVSEGLLGFTVQDGTSTLASVLVSAALSMALVALALASTGGTSRALILRVVLLTAAAGEAVGATAQVVLTRPFIERSGRPYHPACHGAVQDFGFYNAAMALALVLAALDPLTNAVVVKVAIVLYAVHGAAHVLRHAGVLAPGSDASGQDLRQGLPLLVGALGMLLFRP